MAANDRILSATCDETIHNVNYELWIMNYEWLPMTGFYQQLATKQSIMLIMNYGL
jgi:hypothetical protein